MKNRLFSIAFLGSFHLCSFAQSVNPAGMNLQERFIPPAGFVRTEYSEGSFQSYIRALPLKKFGSDVMLHNGLKKTGAVHASVFSIPLLRDDLLQCADMIMKIRAEYLYSLGSYRDISFTISNGMDVPFTRFAEGYRVTVKGNETSWEGGYRKGFSREGFDSWLRFIYAYAGTLSLSKELITVPIEDIRVGDVFITGGSPGHAVMVLDLASDSASGKRIMLLGQSYMPSQEFHVLKSFSAVSPWYFIADETLKTPEWVFPRGRLRRFR